MSWADPTQATVKLYPIVLKQVTTSFPSLPLHLEKRGLYILQESWEEASLGNQWNNSRRSRCQEASLQQKVFVGKKTARGENTPAAPCSEVVLTAQRLGAPSSWIVPSPQRFWQSIAFKAANLHPLHHIRNSRVMQDSGQSQQNMAWQP